MSRPRMLYMSEAEFSNGPGKGWRSRGRLLALEASGADVRRPQRRATNDFEDRFVDALDAARAMGTNLDERRSNLAAQIELLEGLVPS